MKPKRWIVQFSENGEEYVGSLTVFAKKLKRDERDDKAFVADGVRVEIDEYIVAVQEL